MERNETEPAFDPASCPHDGGAAAAALLRASALPASDDFRLLFESLPAAYAVLRPNLKIAAASDAYMAAARKERGEILGRDIFEVFPDNPEDPTASGVRNLQASFDRVLRERRPDTMAVQQYDVQLPAAEGGSFEVRYWSTHNVPVLGPGGEVRFIIHRVEDVTDLVRLQQQDARTSQRLNSLEERHARVQFELMQRNKDLAGQRDLTDRIIQHVPAGVAFLDRNLVFRLCNPYYAAALRLTREDILNHPLEEVLPGGEEQILSLLQQVFETGKPYHASEFPFTYRMPDGTERTTYWDFVYVPVKGRGEEVEGILVLNNEVSERIERERERQRLYDEHSRLQKDRIEALEATDRIKDEWLSIISHELRTPLNFISGFACILEDGLAGPLNPQQHTYMEKILEGSDRMLGIVNDLLDSSRLLAGSFTLNLEETSYQEVIDRTLSTMRPLIDEKGLALTVYVEVPRALTIDAQRLIQVLTNLLRNAVNFTATGGRLSVSARLAGDRVLTEVSDTGVGIPAEEATAIFKRFHQVDGTSTRAVGGTGLGLYIAKAIVEAHGGAIGVRSAGIGKGSTFWFTLPLDPVKPAPERA